MNFNRLICIVLLLMLANSSFSFDRDSLLTIYKNKENNIESREKALIHLYRYYMSKDLDSALLISKVRLELVKKHNMDDQLFEAYSAIGNINFYQSNYLNALKYYNHAKSVAKNNGDLKKEARTLVGIGSVYGSIGNYKKSLAVFLEAKAFSEELGDDERIHAINSNLSILYRNLKQYDKAEKLVKLSMQYYLDNESYTTELMNTYISLSAIYEEQKEYELSISTAKMGLKLAIKYQLKRSISSLLHEIGYNYNVIGEIDSALVYFKESLRLEKELNGEIGLANHYISLGNVNAKLKQFKVAREQCLKAYEIARKQSNYVQIASSCQCLQSVYDSLKDYPIALKYHRLYMEAKDSIYNKETKSSIVRSEMKYEMEKDSIKNAQLQMRKQLEYDKKIQTQKTYTWIGMGGAVIVLLFLLFLYRSYREKKNANNVLAEKNDLITKQKSLVEEKNKEITDSINYAERIQAALLQSQHAIANVGVEHFMYYNPKDIVSGDFYWSKKVGDYCYLAVMDCTGHGVPGGFMSMLGMAFLNEVTSGEKPLTPGDVLSELSEKIITQLGQTDDVNSSKDGMDASLLRVNLKTKEIMWAGANNPLWVLPNGVKSEKDVQQIKGTKQPIGYARNKVSFENHTIEETHATIYMFTDGFPDQFGGERNKKYGYRQFREKLVAISQLPLAQQKKELQTSFASWKGDVEQIDDVCVAGIKL